MAVIDKDDKFSYFQVEVSKLGHRWRLTIEVKEVRVGRGKKKIIAEGYLRDPHHLIRFFLDGAPAYKIVVPLMLRQIDRRGFRPDAFRYWAGNKWGPWSDIPRED